MRITSIPPPPPRCYSGLYRRELGLMQVCIVSYRLSSHLTRRCRTLGYAVGGLVIVIFIVTTSLRIDKVHHPTGPFPSPPSRPVQPGATRNPAYLIEARNGAVASENGVCSEVGVDVLKDGGNAVDAAIASTFCIGVLNLFS